MCKRKLLTGSNNFSQKDLCLQRSGLGLNRNRAKTRSVLDQGLWVRVQWTLSRYLMRSVLVQQTNCTPALWSSCCDWDRKKMYFHNILDAVKCQQVIWSILCDHDDSLQWALVSGQEGQPLTQKTPKCFPCCLLNTKIVLQVQLSWNCLFFPGGKQQDITFQEAKWSSFVPVFFCVVLQDCALGSSNRRAMNVQETNWVLLHLFCFAMMLLYTSLDSTNNTVLENLPWLSQVCWHWMLLCLWNHKLSSLVLRHSSL